MNRACLARAVGLLFCLVQTSLLAEPSTVQIRESSKDRAVTLQTQGDAGTVSYLSPFATGQSSVTATLGLEGIDVASFDENTRFELVVGRHAIAKRLGDDPKYRKGSTVATFSESTSSPASDDAPAATDSRRLQLKWSTKSLRATLSLRSSDLEGAPWAMAWAGPMRGESSGKSLSAVIAGHIAFGPQASSAFEIKATGKLGLKRMPQRTPGFEPVTLSSVSLAGSGRGSDRVFMQPGIERISESQVAAAGFSSAGGSVTVGSGSFEGASLTVPSGAFPDGVRIELNETKMMVDKGGKRIELPGLRVSGNVPSPTGAYLDLTLPGMINADGFTLPYGVNDDGSLESPEILSVDPVSGSIRVRLRVPPSPAVPSDLQPAELTQRAKSGGNATSWDTEFAFLASLFGIGSTQDWFDGNGASGWGAGLKRGWDDFWSKRQEPEPEPIETPVWREAVEDYSSSVSEALPEAQVDSWASKQIAFEAAQSEMRDEEANNQRYFAGTGFVPRTHGFATSSGRSTYLADTSGGMVRFAHWAFREKQRLPLHDLYNYPAEIDFGSKTAQDVIAARASASESGQLAISPWLPGIMRYGQILTSIGVFSKEVPLMVSKVDSNGNFIGIRHLLAYGIGHTAGSEYKPRIVVYDPSAPGAGNRVVRYHPDYGMFYQFPDGSFGVDVRPVAALVPLGPGPTESLSRIYNLAQLGQLNGISEVKNFSIPQGDYVTENPAKVKFDLQDGGELPVRRLFVNDEPFDVPIEDKVERGMIVSLDPGPNVWNLKMYGRVNGENLPLRHPDMTANPREVYYLKMPLTITKIAGDRQSAPEGSLQLRDNLKVVVKDANGLPVPYPTLKWGIVDPAAYGGGTLSTSSSSGASLTASYLSPEGEGWVSWKLGSQKDMEQKVSVEVVGLNRLDKVQNQLIQVPLNIETGDPVFFSSGLTDELVLIPGGSFTMGDNLDGNFYADAPPVTVTVGTFYMGKNEVTKTLWDKVRTWAAANGYTDLPTGAGKAADHPVQTVDSIDVIKWCNARSEKEGLTPCYTVSGAVMKTGVEVPTVNWSANGYRLPTEAEWEKAARGGLSGRRFPWGDTISHSQANFNNESGETYQSGTTGFHPTYATGSGPYTSPVGSFASNGYGLNDMAGNVWEWCWDLYGVSTYVNGSTNPWGPASGSYYSGSNRVIRGGSSLNDASFCRVAYRGNTRPWIESNVIGFRIARSSVP